MEGLSNNTARPVSGGRWTRDLRLLCTAAACILPSDFISSLSSGQLQPAEPQQRSPTHHTSSRSFSCYVSLLSSSQFYILNLSMLPSTRATPSASREAYHSPWCSWFSTSDCNIALSSEGPLFDPRRGDVGLLRIFGISGVCSMRMPVFFSLLNGCRAQVFQGFINPSTALVWPECFRTFGELYPIDERFFTSSFSLLIMTSCLLLNHMCVIFFFLCSSRCPIG